jgi:hypothetical protein
MFWRRGWDSNHDGVLSLRNLLISQNGRNAKNAQNASLRYTAGTRTASRVHWEFENPGVKIKRPSATHRYEGRWLQGLAT